MVQIRLDSVIPGSEWLGVDIPQDFTALYFDFRVLTGKLEDVQSILLYRRSWLDDVGEDYLEPASRLYPKYGSILVVTFPVVYTVDLVPNQIQFTKRYLARSYSYTEPNWRVTPTIFTTTPLVP